MNSPDKCVTGSRRREPEYGGGRSSGTAGGRRPLSQSRGETPAAKYAPCKCPISIPAGRRLRGPARTPFKFIIPRRDQSKWHRGPNRARHTWNVIAGNRLQTKPRFRGVTVTFRRAIYFEWKFFQNLWGILLLRGPKHNFVWSPLHYKVCLKSNVGDLIVKRRAFEPVGSSWEDVNFRTRGGWVVSDYHGVPLNSFLSPVQVVMQRSLEQRIAIKFCVKLGKSAMETFPITKIVFGNYLSKRGKRKRYLRSWR